MLPSPGPWSQPIEDTFLGHFTTSNKYLANTFCQTCSWMTWQKGSNVNSEWKPQLWSTYWSWLMTMIEVEMAESGPSSSWPTTSWHHLIKHGRWVSYLAHCCGEMSDKSSSRREFWFTASVYNLSWWAKQDMRQTLTFDLQPRSPLTPAIVASFCEFHQIMNGERKNPPWCSQLFVIGSTS